MDKVGDSEPQSDDALDGGTDFMTYFATVFTCQFNIMLAFYCGSCTIFPILANDELKNQWGFENTFCFARSKAINLLIYTFSFIWLVATIAGQSFT